jgi:hypothetical protein
MAIEMAAWETPAQYLETHFVTRELQRLGVTQEQLQAIRFRGTNEGLPFDRWSFTLPGTRSIPAISLVKAYAALKWLILANPSYSRDKDDAWRLVAETMAAPTLAIGGKAREAQSERAKKPRGKISDKETIGQLITKLAVSPKYRLSAPRALWPVLWARLDGYLLDPKDITDPNDLENPKRWAYVYDSNDGVKRKKMTFLRFRDIVSEARKRKKSR